MPAKLYVVGTPLGNLDDLTPRAARTLAEADVIACEDTRRTGRLLERIGVRKPLVSYHEHNEESRAAELVRRVEAGETVALVSDAGMPLVSDPGYRLVRAAIDAGVDVVPIPGPDAATTALVVSGLPVDAYRFCGFLPAKSTQRRKALDALATDPATLVIYEAPHRIVRTLTDALEILGDRKAALARELTKLHEEVVRGSLSAIFADFSARENIRGEMVLVIAPGEAPPVADIPLPERVAALIDEGVPRMDAIKQAARERGISKRDAYRLLEQTS